MSEERLIKILHRVSNDDRYVILLNGNTVSIVGDTIWLDEDGCDFYHNLNSLSIVRNHGECIDILLGRSEYELEITMKQNINNL